MGKDQGGSGGSTRFTVRFDAAGPLGRLDSASILIAIPFFVQFRVGTRASARDPGRLGESGGTVLARNEPRKFLRARRAPRRAPRR